MTHSSGCEDFHVLVLFSTIVSVEYASDIVSYSVNSLLRGWPRLLSSVRSDESLLIVLSLMSWIWTVNECVSGTLPTHVV